jgi:leader peptidase (prepilin peptidase)/N-methyltransferase
MGSIVILSGIYLILYQISHGKWIGFGDIKLGLGLALLLADWQLAFVALFMANIIGCLWVIPGMVVGKLKRNSHVPFGPLLIAGGLIAQMIGPYLISAYMSLLI